MDETATPPAGSLTFHEVRLSGRRAFHALPLSREELTRLKSYREYLFEDGDVWMTIRDVHKVWSMRLALCDEIPVDGWRHSSNCDCTHCGNVSPRSPANP